MKAIVLKDFGGVENFDLQEVAVPEVKPHEVLIRIKATAFNPIDYQMRQGSTESKLLKSPILGRELSGEIVETGEKVTRLQTGDKVSAYVGSLASNGTYTEYISVPQELVAKNPDNISFEEAAALPMVGMTALQCFKRVDIPKDKPVFITGGAGGVGTILIKLLLAKGNQSVYTTAGNERSIAHLTGLGLPSENIFNYKQDDLTSAVPSRLGEQALEYCIDLVGGKLSELCAGLLDVYGTYVDITFLTTPEARELLFDKANIIVNVANYAHTLKKGEMDLSYYGESLQELFRLIENGNITPAAINTVGELSVDTVKKAHTLMENNQTKGSKLVMINY
ncbi:NADP-dependent oxidoreductase [Rapidithrix thailandica]|uniref:NADP-dependent oxidoreductase n=1 Tax=Rapidithrix thailandica TaxID=413964 RepID=A0AAW9S8S3_9BACT